MNIRLNDWGKYGLSQTRWQLTVTTLLTLPWEDDLDLVELLPDLGDVLALCPDDLPVEAALDDDIALLLVFHLVLHLEQLLLGAEHALLRALDLDDGGRLVLRDRDVHVVVGLDPAEGEGAGLVAWSAAKCGASYTTQRHDM